MPPVAPEVGARQTQLQERAFWMLRDLEQADAVRDMCNKLGEVVSLVDANNEGPE